MFLLVCSFVSSLWMASFPMTNIFPSDYEEWEPLESFIGKFDAVHENIGKLLHDGERPITVSFWASFDPRSGCEVKNHHSSF